MLFVLVFLFLGSKSSYAASSSTTVSSNSIDVCFNQGHQEEELIFSYTSEQAYFTESGEEISEEEEHFPYNLGLEIAARCHNTYLCLQRLHGTILEFEKSTLVSSLPKYIKLEVFRI